MFKKSVLAFSLVVLFGSCDNDEVLVEPGKLQLKFDNVVGSEDFQVKKNYVIDGRNYTFENFRYWISNIRLQKEDGSWLAVEDSYFLIEETGYISIQDGKYIYPARKREDVSLSGITAGKYKAIEFAVGVDKEKNDNLSLTSGELSTMNGMTNIAWMWHTSYIFSSLKGMVENNTSKVLKIETGLNDNYRTVKLNLSSAITVDSGKDATITFKGDIITLLKSFDSWEVPVVGAQQTNEMKSVSDNFATKFFTLK